LGSLLAISYPLNQTLEPTVFCGLGIFFSWICRLLNEALENKL
jgi:hypothetical protein